MSSGQFPTLGDNQQAIVDLLRIIADNTGGLDDLGDDEAGDEITVYQGFRPGNLLVTETSQMELSTEGGAITVHPGQTETLVEWENRSPIALLAIGATDTPDCVYSLVIDGDRQIQTYSPLGTITSPFSFVEQLGAPFPAGNEIEYRVSLSASADEPVELAARAFLDLTS